MDHDTFERFSALDFSQGSAESSKGLFETYQELNSGKVADLDVQLISTLKSQHPELIVTAVPSTNVRLLLFASAGFATAELDLDDEAVVRWRGFIPPAQRGGSGGYLTDATFFARYRYRWGQEDFLLYIVKIGYSEMQYILKEPRGGEKLQGHSRVTDALLTAIGQWMSIEPDALYVFDRFWMKSPDLWHEVQKASWDKVILDSNMKKELVSVCDTFFDSKQTYEEYSVPWKRGLIFYGPPGNGKTISIKALMHSMYQRKAKIPCLYVKSAPATYMIAQVFQLARSEAPCLLIFEDIDTIVTPSTRAYFFNEVDGVANNDGIMMIASTNYLDRLDPGLTKRPSRFDRKYLFPLPNRAERILYAQFWQHKLDGKPIEFPDELCPAVADITDDFSFAYMQELFIASLLQLARADDAASASKHKDHDELDKYKLWVILKRQAKILREDMGEEARGTSAEQLPPLDATTEPHRSGADINIPFPLSSRGSVSSGLALGAADAQPRDMQPVFGGRRLTPEDALFSLNKVRIIGDKAFTWGPSPSNYM